MKNNWPTAPLPNLEKLTLYQNSVKALLDVDPIALLKREREFFKWDKDVHARMTRFIDGEFGKITNMGCLEASLLELQIENFGEGTEFLAYVLEKGKINKALVMSWGAQFVNPSLEFEALVQAEVAKGWKPLIHLHNHIFFLEQFPDDVAGTVLPSYPDFGLYEKRRLELDLQSAWVTNGFSTGKFSKEEFNP